MSWLTRLFHKEGAPAAQAAEPVTAEADAEPQVSREQRLAELRATRAAAAAEAERAAKAAARERATALAEAARTGDLETARAMLDAGAAVDSTNKYDEPVLIVAADWGHTPIVELLLARGADPNTANKFGHTALIAALYGGSEAAVRMLIEAGADFHVRSQAPVKTCVDLAEHSCLPEIARMFREAGIEEMISRAEHLEAAASMGRLAAVEYHLAAGTRFDPAELGTALSKAARAGGNERADSVAIARLLIAAGADVDFRDEYGTPVLLHAVHHGNADLVRFLAEQGADPDLPDGHGETARIHAGQGRSEAMQAMAHNLANAKPRRASEVADLPAASVAGNLDLVRHALDSGADPNARDREGVPALVLAAENGHGPVIELLLARGADMKLTAKGGLTAMEAAVLFNRPDALRFLVAAEQTADRS
jgi:ankyrin repeat protein